MAQLPILFNWNSHYRGCCSAGGVQWTPIKLFGNDFRMTEGGVGDTRTAFSTKFPLKLPLTELQ